RSPVAGDEGPRRAGAAIASEGRARARAGRRNRPRRHPALCKAAIHLVSAPIAGVRVGEAGRGEGTVAATIGLRRIRRTVSRVSCSQPRFESALLIEAMDAWIGPAALQEDMMAI